jgi:hypothetical protein
LPNRFPWVDSSELFAIVRPSLALLAASIIRFGLGLPPGLAYSIFLLNTLLAEALSESIGSAIFI